MRILKAGILYLAIVFGSGFVLGIIRTLWVVPWVGMRMAELMESPIMLVVTIVAARWIVHRLSVPPTGRLRNPAFAIPPSRSHDIETKTITPSILRLYTLARVYKCRLDELLSSYGIPPR